MADVMRYERGCWVVETALSHGRWKTTVTRDGVLMKHATYASTSDAVVGHGRSVQTWVDAWWEYARQCGAPSEVEVAA